MALLAECGHPETKPPRFVQRRGRDVAYRVCENCWQYAARTGDTGVQPIVDNSNILGADEDEDEES